MRREFALDVAIELSDMPDAAVRALKGLPVSEAPRHVVEHAEFSFTGKDKGIFSSHHPLFKKMRDSWEMAVQGVFELLTGSDVWPPAGAPAGMVAAAVQLKPACVQLYRGIKIMRPGVSNTTLQCSPSFHGRPRQDTVLLNSADGAYDDIQNVEYGLVHCFFSYDDPCLIELLRWGVESFGVDFDDPEDGDAFMQYTQFFLMQRYRKSALGNALLPLDTYAAKDLSDDFETDCVGAIHSRACPMPWFHGTADDDMRRKKGAIFCVYK